MRLRTAMVVYADDEVVHALRAAPVLDRPATRDLVGRLFAGQQLQEIGAALLVDGVNPPDDVVYAGSFGTVDIVCSWRLVDGAPSARAGDLLAATRRRSMYLHVVRCDGEDCAFALWRDGVLLRSLRVAPDCAVPEESGERLPFEQAYWQSSDRAAEHRPVDLGRRALHELFGFVRAGDGKVDGVDPEVIPLVGYRVSAAVSATGCPGAAQRSAASRPP
jgi:hypothetical protein